MVVIISVSTDNVKCLIFSSVCIELSESGDKTGQTVSSDGSIAEPVSVRIMMRINICEGCEHKARDDGGQGSDG